MQGGRVITQFKLKQFFKLLLECIIINSEWNEEAFTIIYFY